MAEGRGEQQSCLKGCSSHPPPPAPLAPTPIQGTDPPCAPKRMPSLWKTDPLSELGMLLSKPVRKKGRRICEHSRCLWSRDCWRSSLYNPICMMSEHSSFKSQPKQIVPDSPCQNPWDGSKGMILTAAGGLWTPWEVPEVSGSSLITLITAFRGRMLSA